MPSKEKADRMPVPGNRHDWDIHSLQNLIEVLSEQGYRYEKRNYPCFKVRLKEEPERPYRLHVLNGTGLKLVPGEAAWETLAAIAKDYLVEVITPSTADVRYVAWTGAPSDLRIVIGIRISVRSAAKAA